ncbi:hypothetical protein [Rhizobium leguminosarum]|uniref:hypothetical protein n=1 Tax=Rhizobium leguminosarum TaxID=384 RepID=UPI00098EAFDC|nr:hypothetical protein [Rhizobium leguminosarum]MBB5255328.1 hypothetical protein [Rhizobium leguminosarum]MBY5328424.1 hypothetical protein [Rhizobium leguminosarum]MDX6000670.1 hypothetical protein [Rhizobium leguminosarum]OOO44622.1 hypothetical protein BS629_31460 [Rhizobium leguminosarum bv. viciae USDA 2370]PUB62643.1 hypothetical protein DB728_12770 [Rhizobium leguminosarum bv. viciae USDA 2370]
MLTREELHHLVWTAPSTKLARGLAVSDSYLNKVCRTLAVPRPPQGHWLKPPADRDAPTPLPPAPPGTPAGWQKGRRRAHRHAFRSGVSEADVATLLDRAACFFAAADVDDGGTYLRPRDRWLVDLTTTRSGLPKCVNFAGELFLALAARGLRVGIASPSEVFVRVDVERRQSGAGRTYNARNRTWSPLRPTVVNVGGFPVGLAIVETCIDRQMHYVGRGRFVSEDEYAMLGPVERAGHTLRRRMHVGTGLLRLIAYSPTIKHDLRLEWTETPKAPLQRRIENIIDEIEATASRFLEPDAGASPD